MTRKKFFITTTIPATLCFFEGQMRALVQSYDVCAVSSPSDRLMDFAGAEGIRCKALKMAREISLLRDGVALLKWIVLLVKERPYVVHGNTPKAALLSMVAAWLTCRPVRIYMCHGLRYQGCTGRKRKLLMLMERITSRCANRVICVSQGVREQLAADGLCPLEKSLVIGYGSAGGVDTDWFDAERVDDSSVREQYHISPEEWPLLFIGRMVRDKGMNELIAVVSRLREEGYPVRLLLVGGREDRLDALLPETERLIAQNAAFITECGHQTDVRPFVKVARALVLPSYREGFGQVLVEANAMGRPVVVSRIIGCSDVVKEGINGLFCEPRSEQSLYDALKRLMADKRLYDAIQDGSRRYVVGRFDSKVVQKGYTDYYKALRPNP